MKRMMLIGGMVGFLLATIIGLNAAEPRWPVLLWRASAAALVCGWITRWWFSLAALCVAQARTERDKLPEPTLAPKPSSLVRQS